MPFDYGVWLAVASRVDWNQDLPRPPSPTRVVNVNLSEASAGSMVRSEVKITVLDPLNKSKKPSPSLEFNL